MGVSPSADLEQMERLALLQAEAAKARQHKRRRRKRRRYYQRPTAYTTREQRCRDLLQTLTRMPHSWESCRPSWLINPRTGKRMEIDCFCSHPMGRFKGACVEVDGQQHYSRVGFYHTQEGDLARQQERDHTKDFIVALHGYAMIRVLPRSKLCDSQLALFLSEELGKILGQ